MPKHFVYKSIIRFEDYSVLKLSFLLHNDCNRGKSQFLSKVPFSFNGNGTYLYSLFYYKATC